MKKIFVLVIICSLAVFSNLKAQDIAYNETSVVLSKTTWSDVKWDREVYDFGKVLYKVPVTAVFTLKNTGGNVLLIKNVKASCGCTNIKYSDKPLLPGKSTEISATYNAASLGNFNKTVRVFLNDEKAVHILTLKGVVVSKK